MESCSDGHEAPASDAVENCSVNLFRTLPPSILVTSPTLTKLDWDRDAPFENEHTLHFESPDPESPMVPSIKALVSGRPRSKHLQFEGSRPGFVKDTLNPLNPKPLI